MPVGATEYALIAQGFGGPEARRLDLQAIGRIGRKAATQKHLARATAEHLVVSGDHLHSAKRIDPILC